MSGLFDAWASFGRRRTPKEGEYIELPELLSDMEHYGISEALVHHAMAVEYAPSFGNERLMIEIAQHPCLHPIWIVLPHHVGDFPPPDELISTMLLRGVRAVRVFPKEHGFTLTPWNAGELCEALAERRIPLFVDADQLSWEHLQQLLVNFPQLLVVLSKVSYRVNRVLYPLLAQYENLHICLGAPYVVHRGLEELCQRFGAERILFGTGTPTFDAGAAVTYLTYANIGDDAKELIGGGNLRRLLTQVASP